METGETIDSYINKVSQRRDMLLNAAADIPLPQAVDVAIHGLPDTFVTLQRDHARKPFQSLQEVALAALQLDVAPSAEALAAFRSNTMLGRGRGRGGGGGRDGSSSGARRGSRSCGCAAGRAQDGSRQNEQRKKMVVTRAAYECAPASFCSCSVCETYHGHQSIACACPR